MEESKRRGQSAVELKGKRECQSQRLWHESLRDTGARWHLKGAYPKQIK